MRWLTYSVREAWLALRRGGRLSVVSLGTILTAFFTLGAFLVVERHLRDAAATWADAAELSVFLEDGLDDSGRLVLQQEIAAHVAVADVQFVSRSEALTRFNHEFPELNDVSSSLAENPFPASLEVRLRSDPRIADVGDRLAESLRNKTGVSDVRYDRQWLADATALGIGLRLVGLCAVVLMIVSAVLTMAAVIRLGLYARKDELEIMELVGAPYAFIRGPFVVEGALLGGAGAAAAIGVLWIAVGAARLAGLETLTALFGTGRILFLDATRAVVLFAGAILVGALAGALASHPSRSTPPRTNRAAGTPDRKEPFPGRSR